MRVAHRIAVLLPIACALVVPTGCGSSATGPTFEVSFDSRMTTSERDEAARVEVYLVESCADVTLGARPVPALASTFVLRDASDGALDGAFDPGDYGLYGVAQAADCAVVAAGCAPVSIADGGDTLAVTLSGFDGSGCTEDAVCSLETGDCGAGAGGSGGNGGTAGAGGAGGRGGVGGAPLKRVEKGLILLYDFDEGGGTTVFDRSNVEPTHDLTIADPDPDHVTWSADHLTINQATSLSTSEAAAKVYSRIVASGELTIEAWVKPARLVSLGTPPDRIITMSQGASNRNFLLGQDGTSTGPAYAVRLRIDGEDSDNGHPTVSTPIGSVTTLLQHIVFVHRTDGSEAIYIDGVAQALYVDEAEAPSFTRNGEFTTWNPGFPIYVANETSNNREWLGELHLIAIYDQALDEDEVEQNYAVGP